MSLNNHGEGVFRLKSALLFVLLYLLAGYFFSAIIRYQFVAGIWADDHLVHWSESFYLWIGAGYSAVVIAGFMLLFEWLPGLLPKKGIGLSQSFWPWLRWLHLAGMYRICGFVLVLLLTSLFDSPVIS